MSDTPSPNLQTCTICGVKIQPLIGADRVIFATGAHATREVLWQKVCQHVKDRPGCINQAKPSPKP
jgi:hypothetical protein